MPGTLPRSILRTVWPGPSVDRLLCVALLEDRRAARARWRQFEAAADFDRLTAGEMELPGLVSKRLETLAPDRQPA